MTTTPQTISPAQPAAALRTQLNRFQRRWRFGLLLSGLCGALFWAGLALLVCGVLDYLAGFGDRGRHTISSVLAVIAGAGVLYGFWEALLFARRQAAAAADASLGTPRREILTALELQAESAPATPLYGWLRGRTIAAAAGKLEALAGTRARPWRQMRRAVLRLLIIVAALGLCVLFAPTASSIIARRLLHPSADIPPYSPLRFALGPAPAEVLYGGDLLVRAEITGGKLKAPVRCLTRDPATRLVEESPAFRENDTSFTRPLEKVSAPVEVAFAVGRARSAWLPVTVRTQPKVQEIVLTLEPPRYSRRPRQEFAVGTQPLAVLPGTRVTARVASNRPLRGGTLRFVPVEGAPAQPEVASTLQDQHHALFTWEARGAARLAVVVSDVLGTASEPVQFEQRITPDQRPEVTLRQPVGDVLATPETELPVEYSATDDLGLARIALVRRLQGYRERAQGEEVEVGSKRQDLGGKLSLAKYGLVPGQTIELTAEAGDTNPTLLGVATSEPARIHIISREKYAELLRDQATLDDFEGRYQALQESMEEARKALEELEKAAASGDPAKAEEARKKALEAHEKAGKVFGEIAKDFPLFDLDPGLSKASEDAAKQLFENAQQLRDLWKASPAELKEALAQLKERLGETEKGMEKEMDRGAKATAAGKVMEQADRFNQALQAQREVVKDFHRLQESLRRGEMQAGQALEGLARRQDEIAGEMRGLEKEMGEALSGLPGELQAMKDEGAKFMEALKELAIPGVMDEAAKAAHGSDSRTADSKAEEALARMEALLQAQNGISGMCRGGGEKFPWPQELSPTMEQMMRSLIPKRGSGEGDGEEEGGSGTGAGGSRENGFSMKGKSRLLPKYGPSRYRTLPRAGEAGKGRGTAGQPGGDQPPVTTGRVASSETRQAGGEALALEAVPEAYREAVKRYFSNPETGDAPKTP